ncbi:MAG: SoxR reducing system RseC family protein [Eubacteriales bacterium]|nr:SoxR reducing system RseC family protein [Eubacteriales bacterium]MDD3882217.1 SoxR reducing system RseC family protein [Eubacteriales bacterium]MDD4512566.1 SoxR reducing system RseC family protein [Eubacteriales bacterium]
MIRTGEVIKSENDSVLIKFSRPTACGKCGMCPKSQREFSLLLSGNYPIGELLDVKLTDGKIAAASVLSYVFPLSMLLAGLALGYVLFPNNELIIALCAFLMLAVSYLVLLLTEKKRRGSGKWRAEIVGIHEGELSDECTGAARD